MLRAEEGEQMHSATPTAGVSFKCLWWGTGAARGRRSPARTPAKLAKDGRSHDLGPINGAFTRMRQ